VELPTGVLFRVLYLFGASRRNSSSANQDNGHFCHISQGERFLVIHILHMPDAEQRRQHAIALAEELRAFERPMPEVKEYDLLLSIAARGVQ
jgi:hypothetical protein